MAINSNELNEDLIAPTQRTQEVLVEQVLWLIKLRWIAVGGIVIAAFTSNYAFSYPLLTTAVPIYACAGLLLLCNIIYFCKDGVYYYHNLSIFLWYSKESLFICVDTEGGTVGVSGFL